MMPMTSNKSIVDRIFDAATLVCNQIHKEDYVREKRRQIISVTSKRCGNCDHWMKVTCEREKKNKEFKSMNTPACSKFLLSGMSMFLRDRFNRELQEADHEPKEPRHP